MDKIKIKLKLGFRYLGPDNGSLPHLNVKYVLPNGEEFDCYDFIDEVGTNAELKDSYNETLKLSHTLEKYSKDGIIVRYNGRKEGEYFASSIDTFSTHFKHESYKNALTKFAETVSNIYYDYNGNRIGFNSQNEFQNMVDIEIYGKVINLSNKKDTDQTRKILVEEIVRNMLYIIEDFNRKRNLGISEHMSPRK